jgi:hypothetical protein
LDRRTRKRFTASIKFTFDCPDLLSFPAASIRTTPRGFGSIVLEDS